MTDQTQQTDQPGAGLDDLQKQAQALDKAAAAEGAKPSKIEEQAAANLVDEVFSVLQMARGIGGPVCHWMTEEKFLKVWSDKRLRDIAEPGAAIMKLNGWTVGDLLGKWAPYAALIAALGAPALETIRAYKETKTVEAAQPGAGNGDGN